MTKRWEELARKDAMHYVDTEHGQDETLFFRLGEKFTNETLARINSNLPDKDRSLEIGAGVGRLTFPHSKVFKELIAVDISPTMLDKLSSSAEQRGIKNIKTFLPNQAWDTADISYIYSYLVFQHITDINIIEQYIERIANCLKQGGVAQLQFDTRNAGILYKTRNLVPDFLLPKNQRKGIRRIRRSSDTLREIFKKCNLTILDEIEPNTAKHIFVLKNE